MRTIDGADGLWSVPSMTDDLAELFENHFHGAALRAFVEQAAVQNDWPCPDATRQRAYQIYEADLRIRRGNG